MITIDIVDEHGRQEASFDDPEALRPLLNDSQLASTRCLAFIDPWGDTVFNRLQVPVLQAELRAWAAQASSERRRRLEALVEFVGSALATPHLYVKLVGD